MTRTVTLCRVDAMPEGTARGFDPGQTGRDTMLVVRHGNTVYGYLDACPHQGGTPMAWRKDAYLNGEGNRIVCSAHGAQFDITTGVCTLGACLGQSLTPVLTSITHGEIHLTSSANQEAI